MTTIPKTMRGLVARKYGPPSTYEVAELPVPAIERPDEVLIKVYAGSIITGDTQFANGSFRFLVSLECVPPAPPSGRSPPPGGPSRPTR